MLRDEQNGAAPLPADGEALHESQNHQQYRRPDSDLAVGRQASHQERHATDEQEAELKQLLAAVLVAEVPEDDTAEWARQESDAVGEECGDKRGSRPSPSAKNTLLKTRVAAVA